MKRRPNFSPAEMEALIDGVAASRAVVAGASSGRVSKASKERAWLAITGGVNAVSQLHRTVGEVRKKWKNLRMVTKAKKEALLSELVQACRSPDGHGGGAVDAAAAALKQLSPTECRVMEILEGGAATAAVDAAIDDLDDGHQLGDDGNWSTDGDAADAEQERPLPIDRSEIILTRRLPRPASPLPLPPAPPTLTLMPAAAQAAVAAAPPALLKPSILTVVESLQRRLLADAEAAAATAASPTAPPSPTAKSRDRHCSRPCQRCRCCHCRPSPSAGSGEQHPAESIERRLLRVEERRLRLEREKLAALRSIGASLRHIAGALTIGNGAPAALSDACQVVKDADEESQEASQQDY